MPFRFNHKDIAILASSTSVKFHKEGLLWFKEKEGKLFNKTSIFSERLVRLYGNLLFFFKGKDISSECSGVVVLEKFKVVHDPSWKEYGFYIEFFVEDEHRYEFAAEHKEDFNEWMKLLRYASLDKLTKKIQVLRNEIQAFTGQDPVISVESLIMGGNRMSLSAHHGHGDDENNGQLIELSVNCSNLIMSKGSPPCAMIQVFTVVPPSTEWMKHSQTEISEKSQEPFFLRTIVFASSFPPITRVKFVVHNVLDRSNFQSEIVGIVVCTLFEVQKTWEGTYNIANMDGNITGSINIVGWKRCPTTRISESKPDLTDGSCNILPEIDDYLDQQKRRFFNVPTTTGRFLRFQDILSESKLCFKIPKLLLGLLIQEEKDGVVELHNIGNLHPQWDIRKESIQNFHIDRIQQYSTRQADLCQYEDLNFKKSVEKAKHELAFIPTNLHLQRLAITEHDDKDYFYDIVTVGAPAAHSLKFKHGGLRRLISSCDEYAKKTLQIDDNNDIRKTKYIKALHMKENLRCYKHDIFCLLDVIKEGKYFDDSNHLMEITTEISLKIGELLTLVSTTFVKDSESELLKARRHGPELHVKSTILTTGTDDAKHKALIWEWTGVEYKTVKQVSDTCDCNLRETLGSFMASVNKTFISKKTDDLHSLLGKLETSLTSLIGKINVLMRFTMMQNHVKDPQMDAIQYRGDIVFSQMLTAVVAGFAQFLSKSIRNTGIMEQACNIGLLVQFESLLTTGGDEMGMLEDMYGGLTMLKKVSFEIVCTNKDSQPTLTGTRSNLIVMFHVQPVLFKLLPKKLRDSRKIKLHPVLFSVGINEQATVAETFGDTSLQESINNENLKYLQIYIDELKKFHSKQSEQANSNVTAFDRLITQLNLAINTKKNKNYEILLLAGEICLCSNGIRVTSCKSAKDRSAMSVTLEMVNILKREHGLREDAFQRVLDSIRSQGTRLINSYKNVGLPKYAFNKVQVKALPSIYRPPEGTIGKYVQT